MRAILTAAQTDIILVITTKAPKPMHLALCAHQIHGWISISCRSQIHISFPSLLSFSLSPATSKSLGVPEHARKLQSIFRRVYSGHSLLAQRGCYDSLSRLWIPWGAKASYESLESGYRVETTIWSKKPFLWRSCQLLYRPCNQWRDVFAFCRYEVTIDDVSR